MYLHSQLNIIIIMISVIYLAFCSFYSKKKEYTANLSCTNPPPTLGDMCLEKDILKIYIHVKNVASKCFELLHYRALI